MAVQLRKQTGTIAESIKEAVFLAIDEQSDVEYEFNETKYHLTLDEAKIKLFSYLNSALNELHNLKQDIERIREKLVRITNAMQKT